MLQAGERVQVVRRAFWDYGGSRRYHDDYGRVDEVGIGTELTVGKAGREPTGHVTVLPNPDRQSGWIVHESCLRSLDQSVADWEREPLGLDEPEPDEQTYVKLDLSDPLEAVLADVVQTNRRKRADYTAADSSPWSNFDAVETQVNGTPGLATEVLIATKQARLMALATREGLPQNESVEDTLLDRAVYAIIALGRYRYPDGKVS